MPLTKTVWLAPVCDFFYLMSRISTKKPSASARENNIYSAERCTVSNNVSKYCVFIFTIRILLYIAPVLGPNLRQFIYLTYNLAFIKEHFQLKSGRMF